MQEDQNQTADNATETTAAGLPNEQSSGAGETSAVTERATAASAGVQQGETERVPHRKVRQGLVVSNKMQKSIVVQVVRRVKHPLYKKYFNKSKKYMAHDENNDCQIGDTVRIIECRPLSTRKRWRLETIVERAK